MYVNLECQYYVMRSLLKPMAKFGCPRNQESNVFVDRTPLINFFIKNMIFIEFERQSQKVLAFK